MSTSYLYVQPEKNHDNAALIESIANFAEKEKLQVFVLDRPMGDSKYSYNYEECLIVLSPGYKIVFLNHGRSAEDFEEYREDFIEDLGSLSDKYQYRNVVGRPRFWRKELVGTCDVIKGKSFNVEKMFADNKLDDATKKKSSKLLVSLLTGSINDIDRVQEGLPQNLLDAVKQKIQLFDGDQTRFIYEKVEKKRVIIQGLSGTGKTELLLHKLKEVYTSDKKSRTLFTCHNKILANDLRNRIPTFFNFMKVEEQIDWENRLWCINAWGSRNNSNSGAYRYICHYYDLPFHTYNYNRSFKSACELVLAAITDHLLEEKGFPFDYILIDESQDFPEEFFTLCDKVSSKNTFVAGDIFQNIFEHKIVNSIEPDYLLSKCYRTDPKTLMFAHGIGMALFEAPKLNWLEDDEWETCGYKVDKSVQEGRNVYHLSREPLRRFDDFVDPGFESIELIETTPADGRDVCAKVLETLRNIRKEYPSACPDDIGVIFIDGSKNIYNIADRLEELIPEKIGWQVNKAYETKKKIDECVFISNKNNVKGLEFPFIICVSDKLNKHPFYRNALYTMISRSFIKTYLLVDTEKNLDLLPNIKMNLARIIDRGIMDVWEPDQNEKDIILTSIKQIIHKVPLYDVVQDIFTELDIPPIFHQSLVEVVTTVCQDEFDREKVREVVEFNYAQMAGGNH